MKMCIAVILCMTMLHGEDIDMWSLNGQHAGSLQDQQGLFLFVFDRSAISELILWKQHIQEHKLLDTTHIVIVVPSYYRYWQDNVLQRIERAVSVSIRPFVAVIFADRMDLQEIIRDTDSVKPLHVVAMHGQDQWQLTDHPSAVLLCQLQHILHR